MNQKIFDTRQRVEELISEAMAVWKQSNYSEYFEELAKDPVFSLLVSAVAYQENEVRDEIERMKSDVLDEFASLLVPYEAEHACPSIAIVQTNTVSGRPEVEMNSYSRFSLGKDGGGFIPLLNSRVLPVRIDSLVRIDGRRWKVKFGFDMPVSDLSMFTFAINKDNFRDLKLFLEGKEVPLTRPWECSELPFTDSFAFKRIMFDGHELYDPSSSVMNLFLAGGMRIFCVRKHNPAEYITEEVNGLSLEFEFTGVSADFSFDRSNLFLNAVVLVNAKENEVTLDTNSPYARIAGGKWDGVLPEQLMHVFKPDSNQMYSEEKVLVRRVAADRFNKAGLVRMLGSLLNKFKTDSYAFQCMKADKRETVMHKLIMDLEELRKLAIQDGADTEGIYLMLENPSKNVSLNLKFLTTNGAALAGQLDASAVFSVPEGLDPAVTSQICEPVLGSDELGLNSKSLAVSKYIMRTNDRIVTNADIRIFCYKELMRRYGIMDNMVKNISVGPKLMRRNDCPGNACGYSILVGICISDSKYIRRILGNRLESAAHVFETMMQARSANIYPIKVKMEIQ